MPRVLLIDDDDLLRQVLQIMLESRYEVVSVGTGQAALDVAETGSFDAVLCDLHLPDLDGRAVYERMVRLAPEYTERFLFCTGGSLEPRLAEFIERFEDRLVPKPCTVTEIREAVGRVVARA